MFLILTQHKLLNWNWSSKSFLSKMHTVLCASLLKAFYFEAQEEHIIFIYYYEENPLISGRKKKKLTNMKIWLWFGQSSRDGREWCFHVERVFDCCIYSINSSSMANVILWAFNSVSGLCINCRGRYFDVQLCWEVWWKNILFLISLDCTGHHGKFCFLTDVFVPNLFFPIWIFFPWRI